MVRLKSSRNCFIKTGFSSCGGVRIITQTLALENDPQLQGPLSGTFHNGFRLAVYATQEPNKYSTSNATPFISAASQSKNEKARKDFGRFVFDPTSFVLRCGRELTQ